MRYKAISVDYRGVLMMMKTVENRWVVSQCPAPGESIYKDNSGPGLGKLLPGVGVHMSGCLASIYQNVRMSGLVSSCQDVMTHDVWISGCLVSICQNV